MTGVYFTADPDGLDALNGRLTGIETDMRGIGVAIGSYSPTDLSPSGDVRKALQEFTDAWSAALKTINGNVSALRDRLASASNGYRGVEGNISNSAQQDTATLHQAGAFTWRVS